MVIVRSRAFSHRKIAQTLANFIGNVKILTISDHIMVYNEPLLAVATLDWFSICSIAKFAGMATRKIYYGVVEGTPIITDLAEKIISEFKVYVPTEYVKEEAERAGIKVHGIVPHAIVVENPLKNKIEELRRTWKKQKPKAEKFVGWIGANQRRKGTDIAFQVAEQLQSISHLLLCHLLTPLISG